MLNSNDYTSLSSGTTYYLRVTVEDEAGNSKVSDVAEQDTVKIYTWYKYTYTTLFTATPVLISDYEQVFIFSWITVTFNGHLYCSETYGTLPMFSAVSGSGKYTLCNMFNFGGSELYYCDGANALGYYIPVVCGNDASNLFNYRYPHNNNTPSLSANMYLCVNGFLGALCSQGSGVNDAKITYYYVSGAVYGIGSISSYCDIVEFVEAVTGFEGDYPNDGVQNGYYYVLQDD